MMGHSDIKTTTIYLAAIVTPERTYTGTADDKMLMSINFGMATKYSDDLSDNVRRGNREALKSGRWPGKPKLGYVRDPETHTLILDPERRVQNHIFNQTLRGAGELSGRVSFDPNQDWIRTWEEVQDKYKPESLFPYDIVVTDMNFGGADHSLNDPESFHGLEIYRYIKTHWPRVEVIVITNYMGTIHLASVLSIMEATGVQRIHAAQWVSRSRTDSGDPGWGHLMAAIEQAVRAIEERKRLEGTMAAEPAFDVLVLARDPLVLDIKKKSGEGLVRLTFDQPKAALVVRTLCEGAPTYISPVKIAERVRALLGTGEGRRLNEADLDWFFRFHNVDPPCGRKSAKVAACDFDPFLLSEAQQKYVSHPCAELPVCPFDLVLLPVSRAAQEHLRRERFLDENVKTHVYQIKKRIAEAVGDRGDAEEWRELLIQGRTGVGYAIAAHVEWSDE